MVRWVTPWVTHYKPKGAFSWVRRYHTAPGTRNNAWATFPASRGWRGILAAADHTTAATSVPQPHRHRRGPEPDRRRTLELLAAVPQR